MEHWREHLKDKPVRYWIRIEIEEIIKEKSIDRKLFYEYSKTKYQKVINRFFFRIKGQYMHIKSYKRNPVLLFPLKWN